ncbi:flagellin [Thermosipho africanus H17ap60334]|uniref:flagellin n=1 Tax=Thermosipho africanus TaxID=2421 RepID=UPI00028CB94D|nr:flagellin [Thermosipho africanus]EKF49811.1 flagellin [Thermosipho africanus H17ap60334]HCF38118.1 flagellin [Thermosipho africanus]
MRINHNISALNAWRSIGQTNMAMSKTLERLSSGLRINRAGDDAAGLAISEKMRGQIKGLNMAIKNSQDAISLIQTAEGALTEVHSILQRMRELSVQASSDTNTDVDRNQIQAELDQLREEIDRIARTTEFNTKKLLDGKLESFRSEVDAKVVTGGNIDLKITGTGNSATPEGTYIIEVGQLSGAETSELDIKISLADSSGVTTATLIVDNSNNTFTTAGITFTWTNLNISDFGGALPKNEIVDAAVARIEATNISANQLIFQIGSNEGHNMIAGIDDMSAGALGITTTSLDVTTQDAAERSIMVIDAAIHKVSSQRAALGAVQNRLEHTIANLGVAAENLTAAESRVRDADMAKEMMEFTKQQILLQSSMGMLAQANAQPQNVLQLLR